MALPIELQSDPTLLQLLEPCRHFATTMTYALFSFGRFGS